MKRIEHKEENGIELKWCGRCKRWLPLSKFANNKVKWDGLQERCNDCRKSHWENIGRFTQAVVPMEVKRKRHRAQVIKSYGLTEEEFNTVLQKQEGKCAICKTSDWGRPSPSIDHDHETNKVRGLLCNRCNRVLGLIGDSIPILKEMIKYLEENGKEETR